jgi:hypothetical protein
MVKTLKILKCLTRYALLRVVHTVWSVSHDLHRAYVVKYFNIFNVLTIT